MKKTLELTKTQAQKIDEFATMLRSAQIAMTHYVEAILDANDLEGTWNVMGNTVDPPELVVEKPDEDEEAVPE